MATTKAPLPPRRNAPQLPARSESSVDTTPAVGGVAARIAALKLDQLVGGLGGAPNQVPRRQSIARSVSDNPQSDADSNVALAEPQQRSLRPNASKGNGSIKRTASSSTTLSSDALAMALKRPPPPPPLPRRAAPTTSEPSRAPEVSQPPPRKVPPLPARRAPIPSSPSDEQAPHHASVPPPVNRASRPPASVPAILIIESQSAHHGPDPHPDPDSETCLKCRPFDHVDAHATLFPRQDVHSLEHLAHSLTAPFTSPTDKARALFTWLHHNIAYDAHAFLTNTVAPSTPERTLRSGLAVCEGYAGLFAALALHAGLHALVISGHGKGFGYTASARSAAPPPFAANHAWNAVVLDDGAWHLVDACWGAGALEGRTYTQRFAPRWFTASAAEFGERHFPTDESLQMRGEGDGAAQTWAEYILAPARPLEMGHFDACGYASAALVPSVLCLVGGQQHVFHIEKQCWHMERRDWYTDYVLMVVASPADGGGGGDETREVMEREAEGGWTAHVDVPAGEGTVTMFIVNSWDGRDARGLDPAQVRGSLGRIAMGLQGVARWEVQ